VGPLRLDALPGLPEIQSGDDLAELLAQASGRLDGGLERTDVLAVAHKVVSKAEGRVVALADVEPGDRAQALAAEHGRDARHVQVILDESTELVRADRGV
jgi:coenzyme F420-0:L-glutamate ligase/coenzyme F420-1:gamma-L-glutamate ligase